MLYFIVDGIESNFGGVLDVRMKEVSLKDQYLGSVDKLLVVVTCVLTLIANTPYHSLKWAFAAVLSCAFTMWYTWTYSDLPL